MHGSKGWDLSVEEEPVVAVEVQEIVGGEIDKVQGERSQKEARNAALVPAVEEKLVLVESIGGLRSRGEDGDVLLLKLDESVGEEVNGHLDAADLSARLWERCVEERQLHEAFYLAEPAAVKRPTAESAWALCGTSSRID